MKGVNIFLADGFEDVEALATNDVLRRGGVATRLVALTDDPQVESSHGVFVTAEAFLPEIDTRHLFVVSCKNQQKEEAAPVKEAAEEVVDKTVEVSEEAAKTVGDALKEAGDAVKDAADAVKDAADKAAEEIKK